MSDTVEYESVEGLDISLDGAVLRLALNRPEKRNAINDTMMYALINAIEAAGRDDRVRAITLEGRGDHFCGGADIVARNADRTAKPRTGSIQRRLPAQAHRLIPLVGSVQVPVVCKVHGWAAGIGFQLALASDFVVTEPGARFWEPFTERGFTPDSGATWLLPRRVGIARARELLLLGRSLDGREALEWGIAHRCVDADALDESAKTLVQHLASGPTVALGLTKWLLDASASASLDDQLADEAFALELSSRTEDFREGMRAFAERRAPKFEGR